MLLQKLTSNMVLMIFEYSMLGLMLILFIIYAIIKLKKGKEITNNYMSTLNESHIKGKISEKEFLRKKKDITN